MPVLEILAVGMFFRLGYKVSRMVILSEGAVYGIALRNSYSVKDAKRAGFGACDSVGRARIR